MDENLIKQLEETLKSKLDRLVPDIQAEYERIIAKRSTLPAKIREQVIKRVKFTESIKYKG